MEDWLTDVVFQMRSSKLGIAVFATSLFVFTNGFQVNAQLELAGQEQKGSAAQIDSEQLQKQNLQSFDYIWKTVRDSYWDPNLGGVDWEALKRELRPQIEKAETPDHVEVDIRIEQSPGTGRGMDDLRRETSVMQSRMVSKWQSSKARPMEESGLANSTTPPWAESAGFGVGSRSG